MFLLNSNGSVTPPPARTSATEVEQNHTHAFFGGFKARPAKKWTIYFDGEHGTADNVFSRIGNYDYTNIRARSRYAPNKKVSFSLAVITMNKRSRASALYVVARLFWSQRIEASTFRELESLQKSISHLTDSSAIDVTEDRAKIPQAARLVAFRTREGRWDFQ